MPKKKKAQETPHIEPDGTSPFMIENQYGADPGEDWLEVAQLSRVDVVWYYDREFRLVTPAIKESAASLPYPPDYRWVGPFVDNLEAYAYKAYIAKEHQLVAVKELLERYSVPVIGYVWWSSEGYFKAKIALPADEAVAAVAAVSHFCDVVRDVTQSNPERWQTVLEFQQRADNPVPEAQAGLAEIYERQLHTIRDLLHKAGVEHSGYSIHGQYQRVERLLHDRERLWESGKRNVISLRSAREWAAAWKQATKRHRAARQKAELEAYNLRQQIKALQEIAEPVSMWQAVQKGRSTALDTMTMMHRLQPLAKKAMNGNGSK